MMLRAILFTFGCLFLTPSHSATRIVILDFELRDLTMRPGIPEEIKRTAGIKAMLEAELKKGGYTIVSVDHAAQQHADAGTGYLFEHADVAAQLARTVNADYILVGRLHKPSFLFAYIMAHLVRVKDGQLMGDYIIETKGGDSKLTLKAVESLAVHIDHDLDRTYTPPAPVAGLLSPK